MVSRSLNSLRLINEIRKKYKECEMAINRNDNIIEAAALIKAEWLTNINY
jgi:hypothetical protein